MGIDRREVGTAQCAIEHGKFHKLFAAKPGLPQIWVAHTQADKKEIGGVLLLVGLLVLYVPYFLTAQSQAGGIVPNLFNPTRLPQFLVMFGFALLALGALFGLSWQLLASAQSTSLPISRGKAGAQLGLLAALIYGLPILFLIAAGFLANTVRGQSLLAASNMGLPEGATSYWPIILERWGSQGWTFLLLGAFLILLLWLLWQVIDRFWATVPVAASATAPTNEQASLLFVLLLAGVGLLLVFAPEFVYLRDNFGSRMNTVFKFYYQAWLLFGLVTSYVGVVALSTLRTQYKGNTLIRLGTNACATLSLVIALSGVVFPLAAAYSKTGGFAGQPTFDVTAYLADQGPAELAAADWVRAYTSPTALIVEGKGASYRSDYNRISTITGRSTLLGWDGHENQWRGKAYGEMAQGRVEALTTIYRSLAPDEIATVLNTWQIDYVYVGPSERGQYEISPSSERALAAATDLAFEQGDVRIYQRRR